MKSIDPSRDLRRLRIDLRGKPVLAASLLPEDALQWGIDSRFHKYSLPSNATQARGTCQVDVSQVPLRPVPKAWTIKRGRALRALREARGTSQGDLAYEVRARFRRRLTGSAVGQFERAENGPSFPVLEAMLEVLRADEREWPELALGRARRALDEREVGLENATATLAAIEEALASVDAHPASWPEPDIGSPRRAASS